MWFLRYAPGSAGLGNLRTADYSVSDNHMGAPFYKQGPASHQRRLLSSARVLSDHPFQRGNLLGHLQSESRVYSPQPPDWFRLRAPSVFGQADAGQRLRTLDGYATWMLPIELRTLWCPAPTQAGQLPG